MESVVGARANILESSPLGSPGSECLPDRRLIARDSNLPGRQIDVENLPGDQHIGATENQRHDRIPKELRASRFFDLLSRPFRFPHDVHVACQGRALQSGKKGFASSSRRTVVGENVARRQAKRLPGGIEFGIERCRLRLVDVNDGKRNERAMRFPRTARPIKPGIDQCPFSRSAPGLLFGHRFEFFAGVAEVLDYLVERVSPSIARQYPRRDERDIDQVILQFLPYLKPFAAHNHRDGFVITENDELLAVLDLADERVHAKPLGIGNRDASCCLKQSHAPLLPVGIIATR